MMICENESAQTVADRKLVSLAYVPSRVLSTALRAKSTNPHAQQYRAAWDLRKMAMEEVAGDGRIG